MKPLGKLVVVSACVLGGAIGTAGIARASGDGDLHPRLVAACERVPNLTIRTENALTRLQAGADTRGSIAWLQMRIDQAAAAGRDQLVTVLQNRKDVRVARIAVLEQQRDALAELDALCTEHGIGT